jgi:predicted nuclease of predicted toxin-antitoxin system
MRFKIDENLPFALVHILRELGHDADHVQSSMLEGSDDPAIWRVARDEDRLLITHDVEFSDARRLEAVPHPGFILLRITQGRAAIIERVREVFATHDVEAWRGCIVTITDEKVRVRRPPGAR